MPAYFLHLQQQFSPVTRLSAIFLGAGVLLSALWFNSLDRYLAARYHWSPKDSWLNVPASAPAANTAQASNPTTSAPPASAAKPLAEFQYQAVPPEGYWPSLAQQKLPDQAVQRILFAGDSMMQGIAPLVMSELAKTQPEWKTTDMSRQSTGLTVRRFFDWPSTIVKAITEQELTAVVIFLGPNDPWDIYEPGLHIRFPSEAWAQRYVQRVDEILAAAKANNVYVLWIGLPSMKEPRLQQGGQIQNAVFHQRSLAHGTDFLSTEPLLGYVNQPYERGALRAGDGIHFTGAGLHAIKKAVLEQLATASSKLP